MRTEISSVPRGRLSLPLLSKKPEAIETELISAKSRIVGEKPTVSRRDAGAAQFPTKSSQSRDKHAVDDAYAPALKHDACEENAR